MNQEQVKDKLLKIEDAPLEFTLIFSGKKSKKVNGLYKPESREIIIHNKNFENNEKGENLLLHTAIHEYAHHLHACSRGGKLSSKAHNSEFWAIFHELLEKAEKKKIYNDVFSTSPKLIKLTETIKTKYLAQNGYLVKEMGKLLLEAHNLCSDLGVRFEDYIDRMLRIPKAAANLAIKVFEYDISPEIGADNMKWVGGISNPEKRKAAENALIKGKSPDTVKVAVKGMTDPEDPVVKLEKEKIRLEKTISTLINRLEEVKKELNSKSNV